jgi:protein CpxP
MRHVHLIAALVLTSTAALAQTPQSPTPASPGTNSTTGSSNNAVNTPPSGQMTSSPAQTSMVRASALESGANSFTEGQAKSRFEDAGIRNVTDLRKDDQGVWRGKAMLNGKAVTVGLDYKGNMAAE